MTQVKTDAVIPSELTIGDQTFKVSETPELQKLITEAQTVIKNQQYSKIESLTTKNGLLEAELSTLKKPSANPSNPTPSASSTPQQVQPPTNPLTERISGSQITKEQLDAALPLVGQLFNDTLGKLLPAIDALNAKVAQLQQKDIQGYRESKIAALGNAVIPELVTGNTIEEIDASIEHSKQVAQRYLTPTANPSLGSPEIVASTAPVQRAPNPAETVFAGESPKVIEIPQTPRYVNPDEAPPIDVKALSSEQYAKERERLMGNLKNELASSN